ncbi:MAG: competence protein ComEA [Armatimonadetes bacterium JP3_11]|jgi:competence protein ComEA|nr:MAG: competence protein ComEA [Armatimonadetes bacterium CP1_7O]OYT74996.1 MAG: competence protein ComEA [Armatimonadetes bacterium JP3_11]RMH06299.1 MAG: ComEA family DNA-binding protein [Armatimonadota bacterium]
MHSIWEKLELKERATLLSVYTASVVLAGLLGYGWGRGGTPPASQTASLQGSAVEVIDLSKPESATRVPPTTEPNTLPEPPSPTTLAVHVAGAVKQPGVYRLPPDSRVEDAIRHAGGATANADLDALNLAETLTDGQKIYVPRKGEAPPPTLATNATHSTTQANPRRAKPTSAVRFPLDLNTATAEQLEAIPGIGPVLAQRIVDYRHTKGRFQSVDELLEVQGIGQKRLETMRPYVVVK